ncbi:MAG TPA: hypothetical protein VK594_14040, partial [Streptosporangiaceae bacterium]|nr:hypothetical protein [Streptosporangiaceae bacterium]
MTTGSRPGIDLHPESFEHHHLRAVPEKYRHQVDVRTFGTGERIVFLPYTREVFAATQAWTRRVFPALPEPAPYDEAVLLPRTDRGSMAVQDLRLVLIPRGRRPVGVQDQGPAPPVNDHLVVECAQEHAVCGTGLAPVGLVLRMVQLTRRRGLV